ncbi:hypothetical protein WDW89_19510 [Deltaproteobacteria bacterium TL4]
MKKNLYTTGITHRMRNTRLMPEDFIILVIHSIQEIQEKIVRLAKEGSFSVYCDDGFKGAIGSALMFTPNIFIFDWDHNRSVCEETLSFIRTQTLAHHIAQTKFLVLISSVNNSKKDLQKLAQSDENVIVVEHQPNIIYNNLLKKNIFRLFLDTQKSLQETMSDSEAASHQHRTASMNEILTQHKHFNEAVIRSFEILVKKVASGNPQKIFDIISKTFEITSRPFIIKYEGQETQLEFSNRAGQDLTRLRELLTRTGKRLAEGEILTQLVSDNDRRCFFGDNYKLFFVTESPDVFDELDNYSMVTKNFEMFLIQAEHRKLQHQMLEQFKSIFSQVYAQMESFEWNESLEAMNELVTEMFSLDSLDQNEDNDPGLSGDLDDLV